MIRDNFINYAHRGASSYAPENTFASFFKAIELEANGIETDIQLTKDGIPVLFHDDTLTRICGIDKKISDFKLSELRDLDFGSFFDSKYQGEKIVTLMDFLEYFSDKPITFALEIKEEGIAGIVVDICCDMLYGKEFYITSFSLDTILFIAKHYSSIKLGYLSQSFDKEVIAALIEAKVAQYCPFAPELKEEEIAYLKDLGFNVRAWGVSDEDVMTKAYRFGVDGMTVNFPDKLKTLMQTE